MKMVFLAMFIEIHVVVVEVLAVVVKNHIV